MKVFNIIKIKLDDYMLLLYLKIFIKNLKNKIINFMS